MNATVPTTIQLLFQHMQLLRNVAHWWGEGGSFYTWNEVERQVHEIPNQRLGAETLEGVLEDLSQSLNGISARLQLSAFTDKVGSVPGN